MELTGGLAAQEVAGEGDRVLWIHGYTLDSSSWRDCWSRLPGWHHIGVDLPGHGASRPWREEDDLPSLAKSIGGAALRAGCRHLVALSFGTTIALQIALLYPESFRSIVLGAPALAGGPQDPEAERLYETLQRLYREGRPGPDLRAAWMEEPSPIFRGLHGKPELWRSLCELVDRHRWEELGTNAMLRLTRYRQPEGALRRIRSPILILLGEQEMPAFRRCGEIIRRAAPDVTRVYLPGIGHLCLLEAPELACGPLDAHLRAHCERAPAAPPAGVTR